MYLNMKYYLILTCLVLFIAQSSCLVFPFCNGRPNFRACYFFRNEGHSFGRDCLRNLNLNMWYYDLWSNDCKRMTFWGCGGNSNRHCSYQECKQRCRWFLRD